MRFIGTALALASALLVTSCQERKAETSEPIRAEMDSGNFGKAAELAAVAAKANPTNPELHLLQARAEARLGNAGNAARALERAIYAGLSDPAGALADPAFDAVRRDETFQRVASRFEPAPRSASAKVDEDVESIRAGGVEITGPPGNETIRAGDIVLDAN